MNAMQTQAMDRAGEIHELIFGRKEPSSEPRINLRQKEAMTPDTAPTPQEPSSISGGGDSVPALLNQWEQKAVLNDLMGLECLINYHDCQEAGAEAVEWGCGAAHARRVLELLALGREIILRDPDLWTDEQKEPFKVRFSERIASLTPTGEAAP